MMQSSASVSSLQAAGAGSEHDYPFLVRAWHAICDFSRRKPLGAAGAIFLLLMVLAAFLASVLAPYDPIQPGTRLLEGPTTAHLLGTDHLGRDMLSRILYGARPSLYTATLVVVLSPGIGSA